MTSGKEKSAWELYKEKLGDTRPWDLINPKTEWADEELATKRLSICKECPFFISLTGQCKQCGCFMNAKTKLSKATCPEHKW
jgi:hypothetical protein